MRTKKRLKVLGLVVVSSILVMFFVSAGAAETEKGLIAHWPLDEGEGGVIKDVSGNGNDGKISGATWTPGRSGSALRFDSSADAVSANYLPSLVLLPSRLKFRMYNKHPNTFVYFPDGKGVNFNYYGSFEPSPSWYHLAFTYDSSSREWVYYLDGEEKVRKTFSIEGRTDYSIRQVATGVTIGREGAGFFPGSIDEIKIYNRALSAEEIKADYKKIADKEYHIPETLAKGVVFDDLNQNGTQDKGEQGVGEVVLSDGLNTSLTDNKGCYELKLPLGKEFSVVFVTVPSDYEATTPFYQKVKISPMGVDSVNFGLRRSPQSRNFSFVQITDTHAGYVKEADFIEDLNEINRFTPKPAFAVNTGDMVNLGQKVSEWEVYIRAIKALKFPLYNVVGNHDMYNYAGGGATRENLHLLFGSGGPTYYSFDYGGVHFVIFDLYTDIKTELSWLKNDLSLQPEDRPIIFFQHQPTDKKILELLSQYNTIATVTGHYHHTRNYLYKDKILDINSPPLCFGGIDNSPRGFRIISIKDGKVSLKHRISGQDKRLTIVSPQGEVRTEDKLKVIANIYDTSLKVVNAEYRIDEGDWQKMTSLGEWRWQAEYKVPEGFSGIHTTKVRATNEKGIAWEKEETFRFLSSSSPLPKPGSDWPMFRNDPAHRGESKDIVSPPLHLAWSTYTGGTIGFSSPAIRGRRLYIGVLDEAGIEKCGIIALDTVSGKILGKYKTDSSVKGTPAVGKDLVYAASVKGTVYALDIETGKEGWRYDLRGDKASCWMYSSPLLYEDVLYVGTYPNFVALAAETGKKIWGITPVGSWGSYSSPLIYNDKVYAGFMNSFYCLEKETGKKVWQRKGTDSDVYFYFLHSTPAIFDDTIYLAGTNGKLYALEAKTGNKLWSAGLDGKISSPAISGSTLYIGSPDGNVYALDKLSGIKLWSYQTGEVLVSLSPYQRGKSSIASSPAISGNTLYIGSADGNLYGLDKRTGKKIWSYNLGVPIASSPTVSGNTVYVGAYDGCVYAFTSMQ
jgi:outer membrane protein assembly factor BamB